jgi:hypothetical protein
MLTSRLLLIGLPVGFFLGFCPPVLNASALQQPSALQDVINWEDGILADGVGPYNATSNPDLLRYWIGHGLRRAQIDIDARERRFNEELGEDQDYPSAIRDLELDELSANQLDHRLFVLTGLQLKATPTDARIQYLSVETPSTPGPLSETLVSPPLGSAFKYDISSIEVIPEHKLLLAIGNAVDPQNPLNNKLLLVLYRYGPLTGGGGEGLVQLQALEKAPLALRDLVIDETPENRRLLRLIDGEAYEIGGEVIAFVRGPMGGLAKGNPQGIAAVKIEPNPAVGGNYLEWYEFSQAALQNPLLPSVVFDPAWDLALGPQSQSFAPSDPPPPVDLAVTSVDLVKQEAAIEPLSLLYMSCKKFNQILQFDVSDFETTGFVPQLKLDLTVPAPNSQSEADPYTDPLYYVSAHHDIYNPGGSIDLLYVIGQLFVHVCERVPDLQGGPDGMSGAVPVYRPVKAETAQFFNIDAGAVGQRMLEYSPLGQTGEPSAFGGREDYWTVCTDVDFPWSIFDMTDRIQKPTAEAPGLVSRRYSPGGTDGAVYIHEWDSAYVTNFGGVVRYDLVVDPLAEDELGNPTPLLICLPDYDSYGPATVFVPQNGAVSAYPKEYVTEQLDLVDISAPDKRLVAVTGRGRVYEWKLDPITHDPISVFSDPPGGRVLPPIADPLDLYDEGAEPKDVVLEELWGLSPEQYSRHNTYSHFVKAGQGVQTGRPYVLIDLAVRASPEPAPGHLTRLLLGRYWFEFTDPNDPQQTLPERFDVLDLTAADLPGAAEVTADIYWIDIIEGGGYAAVGCGNGLYVVKLFGEGSGGPESDPEFESDADWSVTDVFHVGEGWNGWTNPFTPSTTHEGFDKVESLAWLGTDFLALSLSSKQVLTCTAAQGVTPSKQEPQAGAIAVFKFDIHSGEVKWQAFFAEDYQGYQPTAGQSCPPAQPAVDEIDGTDYSAGGAIGAIEVSAGVYRIYSGSSGSGAVVEFELVHATSPTVVQLDTWIDETHATQVSVCRPQLIGLPSGLPIVLLGRYAQTIAVLAPAGAFDDPGE